MNENTQDQTELEIAAEKFLLQMMRENRTKTLQYFLSCIAREMHAANATDLELSCHLDIEGQRYSIVTKSELTPIVQA